MKSKWARIRLQAVSIALVGTMLLTGCGGSASDKKENSKEEKKEVSDNLNKEGLPILKEKETFTIAVPQKSTLKAAAEKPCVKFQLPVGRKKLTLCLIQIVCQMQLSVLWICLKIMNS